jgi:hypothetical protein
MAMVLIAYDYANDHPHKYLKGTTNWCEAVAFSLRQQMNVSEPRPVTLHERVSILKDVNVSYAADSGAKTDRPKGCCCPPIGYSGMWSVPGALRFAVIRY